MPPRRPLVIGHRGAPGYRPEHTRSSYALALALGLDAVEPDVVFSSDGVLVVRHENEISSTTDVAERPEFAGRRTTKAVDGKRLSGWFAEDFTWAELATLRCRERLPQLRPDSATFDGTEPPLRLRDLLDLVREASFEQGREIGVVLEIKHATYFAALGFDVAGVIAGELRAARWGDGERRLWIESFESTILADVRAHGIRGVYVALIEAAGRPYDLVAAQGRRAPSYADQVSPEGLDRFVGAVDGISVDKSMVLAENGPDLVTAAHARGLRVFVWTCRPENAFLAARFRAGRGKAAFGDYEAEWRALADAGADGVFVDHPDLGMAVFDGATRDV